MTVRIEPFGLRTAALGPVNPLPMVGAPLESPYTIDGAIPDEIIAGSRYGNPRNLFPYREQNGYGRELVPRETTSIVLENDRLRARLLPELGGRLWELTDLATGVALLHSPATVQFANLALRNAWFAGGIEWNIGTRGHSPSTCEPLHTAIVMTPDGREIVRMWEFDRLREVVFQVDVWLPERSAVLFVAVRIRNPNEHSVPIYWWSNAAVPLAEDSRVIAPADTAFATDYGHGISRTTPTDDGGVDCTWPTNNRRARDFFFDIPEHERRWIVNAGADGDGLAMVSTRQLRGRKLFVWGQGTGGESWQSWLSPDGERYAEIQAGLAQTQFQHLELPAGGEFSWVEAYGNARLDPVSAHGQWEAAVGHCSATIDELVSAAAMDEAHSAAVETMDIPPTRTVVTGNGWGALERARRIRSSLRWIDESGTPFPEASIGDEQRPWLALLDGGRFSGAEAFVAGTDWELLLSGGTQNAGTLVHRAVMRHAVGDIGPALDLYREAIAAGDTVAAHRGLALLGVNRADAAAAREHYAEACSADPANASLLIEAATTALGLDAPDEALRLIEASDGTVRRLGRVQLLRANALAGVGRFDEATGILRAGIEVADLREGANTMAALWRRLLPEEPVPREYQFSMTGGE